MRAGFYTLNHETTITCTIQAFAYDSYIHLHVHTCTVDNKKLSSLVHEWT